MLAATAGGVLAFGLVLAAAVLLLGPQSPTEDPASVGTPQATETFQNPPATEVQRVHDALHDISDRCPRNTQAGAGEQRQVDRDIDVILGFAERYPNAEFPIDDETGRTLSLLLATHDDLRTCAPAAAARVDRALPTQYQDPSSKSGR